MITLSRYRGVRPEIDPDQDQKLITVSQKTMRNGRDLLISKDGIFYVKSWQMFNDQETAGFYQIAPNEAREMIRIRQLEMNGDQQKAAERIFPGVFRGS